MTAVNSEGMQRLLWIKEPRLSHELAADLRGIFQEAQVWQACEVQV